MGNAIGRIAPAQLPRDCQTARSELTLTPPGELVDLTQHDYAKTLRELGLPVAHPGGIFARDGSSTQKNLRDAIHVFAGQPVSLPQIVDIFCTGEPADKLLGLLYLAGSGLIDLNRLEAEVPGLPITSIVHLIAECGVQATDKPQALSLYQRLRGLADAGISLDSGDETGVSPLHRAATRPDSDGVWALIDAGADPFITTGHELNALHIAAASNGCIDALIKAGLNIEAKDFFGRTPLHHATEKGQHQAMATLLASGARVDAPNAEGATAMHIAASQGDMIALRLLHKKGAQTNARSHSRDTPLHCAVTDGKIEAAYELLASGGDPLAVNVRGETPLLLSASTCELQCYQEILIKAMKQVLAAGPDALAGTPQASDTALKDLVCMADHAGNTALHWAMWNADLNFVQFLLQCGANPRSQNEKGETLLHLAARLDDAGLVSALKQLGLGEIRDQNGHTALHLAARKGCLQALRALIVCTSSVDICDLEGNTPLHLAAAFGHTQIVLELLGAGAKIDSRDSHQVTPFMHAARSAQPEMLQLLGRHGANIHASDISGNTALHWAAAVGSETCVASLLFSGVNAMRKNQCNETPAEVARNFGYTHLAPFLPPPAQPAVVTSPALQEPSHGK